MAIQNKGAEPPPSHMAEYPLRPHERKVAEALLMVMRIALETNPISGQIIKNVFVTNLPLTSFFLELLPEEGKLPSLQQLEQSVSDTCRQCLGGISRLCAEAEFEPLEVFTRSAMCMTHLTASLSYDTSAGPVRQQRLQGIAASLGISGTAEARRRELDSEDSAKIRELFDRVDLLSKQGVARKTCALIITLLHETMLLLDADKGDNRLSAGWSSNFTTCIDHMLPGERAVKAHGNNTHSQSNGLGLVCLACAETASHQSTLPDSCAEVMIMMGS